MAAANPITFLKEVRTELARVIWPTREETIKLTVVVLAVSIGTGLLIGGLDIVFVKMMEFLIKR